MTNNKFLAAYQAGRRAHNDGLGSHNNHYPERTRERELWFAGWCHRNAECAAMNLWSRCNPSADAPPPPAGEDLEP